MKRGLLIVLFMATMISFTVAQGLESNVTPGVISTEIPDDDKPLQVYEYKPIRKGDKYAKIGIGAGFPLFNTSSKKFAIKPNIYPGGKIFLGMHFYLNSALSLGGDISLEFYPTVAKNLYFMVPLTFSVGYTPTYKKWRFPIGIDVGGTFMSYLEGRYFGLYIKPYASFYYQYSPEWSFGGQVDWSIISEFRKHGNSRALNDLGVSFAVRYHF